MITLILFLVGQAGCQIANSCWEVSRAVPASRLVIRKLIWNSYTASNMAFRSINSGFTLLVYTNNQQPDGYLTEERKAADPDHGFSTFFSETGTSVVFVRRRQVLIYDRTRKICATNNLLRSGAKCRRRGPHRYLPQLVPPRMHDHRKRGCLKQLCSRSLHSR